MAPLTVTEDFTSELPASKLFQIFAIDGEKHLPSIVPQAIKSIQTIHGQGEAGTIRKIIFADDTFVKSHVNAINKEKFYYKYTFVEGDMLKAKNLESIVYEIKLESTADGKCSGKETVIYNPKDAGAEITEEHVKEIKDKGKSIFKAVEAYCLANP